MPQGPDGDQHVGRRLCRRSRRQPRVAHGARWRASARLDVRREVNGRVRALSDEHFSSIAALILARRMADLGIGPWGDEPTFHAPCFVVTHRPAETIIKKGGTSYVFVTDGIEAALPRAQEAAGSQDVLVNGRCGRCPPVPQCRAARRGPPPPGASGVGRRHPLFDGVRSDVGLVTREALSSRLATHLTYDVERAAGGDRR
jgi:hypothetical protein